MPARGERGRAGARAPGRFSKPPCAVAAGPCAGRERAGRCAVSAGAGGRGRGSEARRGAGCSRPQVGWSDLTAGTRRRRAGGHGGGGGGAGRHREAWAVTRAPERGSDGSRRPAAPRAAGEGGFPRRGAAFVSREWGAERGASPRAAEARVGSGLRWGDRRGAYGAASSQGPGRGGSPRRRARRSPDSLACVLTRRFPGTLCAGSPGHRVGTLAPPHPEWSARGGPRRSLTHPRPAESWALTGPAARTRVAWGPPPPRLGSIPGRLRGGRRWPPGWTPSRGPGGKAGWALLRWQESASLRGRARARIVRVYWQVTSSLGPQGAGGRGHLFAPPLRFFFFFGASTPLDPCKARLWQRVFQSLAHLYVLS